MNLNNHDLDKMRVLRPDELMLVSGGAVAEKENLYPRRPGQREVAVYVDGMYMGTAHVNPNDPLGLFNPPIPAN